MKSILQNEKVCWLCGGTGNLDRHHVYGGTARKMSEKYGLTVWLCHDACHEFGPFSVHQCGESRRRLQAWAQAKAMEHYGWTIKDWMMLFHKNYKEELFLPTRALQARLRRFRRRSVKLHPL